MKNRIYASFLMVLSILTSLLIASCEEKIDLQIDDAEPKLVIQAEINNYQNLQTVHVFRTTGLQNIDFNTPVSDAQVLVIDSRGRQYLFKEQNAGVYQAEGLQGRSGIGYELLVKVGGDVYESQALLPDMVQVDSIGTYSSVFFGQERKFVTIKFQDPPGVRNYYRYLMSVNGGDFEEVGVFTDRYNDGKFVNHELSLRDESLESGDKVRIYRQCVNQGFYDFWMSRMYSNPGSSAPANPTSNISNGALGYFGTYAQLIYQIDIP